MQKPIYSLYKCVERIWSEVAVLLLLLVLHPSLMHINIFTKCNNKNNNKTKSGKKKHCKEKTSELFFVGWSHCSKALSFWVPSCLRLCIRTLREPNERKRIPLWLENGPSYLRLVRFFTAPLCSWLWSYVWLCVPIFFSVPPVLLSSPILFLLCSSLCSQQIIINSMPTFRAAFFHFLLSLFVLNGLCANISSTVSSLLGSFCCDFLWLTVFFICWFGVDM